MMKVQEGAVLGKARSEMWGMLLGGVLAVIHIAVCCTSYIVS